MSTSKLPFDPPMDGVLRFPRSDGSPKCRPTYTKENAPPGVLNYLEPVLPYEQRHKDWRQKVAFYLMKLLATHIKANPYIKYTIADFPKHYVLYSKPRMSGATEQRDDLHLFGSTNVNNFRSPREFVYHAYWLMTDPTMNPKNCECTWCSGTSQKELSRRLGANVDHYSDGTGVKQHPTYDAEDPNELLYTPPASPVEPAAKIAQSKLRDKPPYRVGEVVWAHLRPPIRGESDAQLIECWPGIVLEVRMRPWRLGGVVDIQLGLKLRLLGTSRDATVDAFDCVPYHAYGVPVALHKYMSTAKPQNVIDQSAYLRLSDFQLFPDVVSDGRPRQVTFDQVWPAFVIGCVMTWRLADRWSLTTLSEEPNTPTAQSSMNSPYSVAPQDKKPTIRKQESQEVIWWGAEGLWVGDLVRLRNDGLAKASLLPHMTPGAETRGIFMKLDNIRVHKMTALSDVWLSGTLYELVPEQDDNEANSAGHAKSEGIDTSSFSDLVALPSLPDAPFGFRFHSILPAGATSFIQLAAVAGRYYPRLEAAPLLAATRGTSKLGPKQLMSLCGYAAVDWPDILPTTYQDRKDMWEGLETEVKKFLYPTWATGGAAMKAEPRR